MIIYKYSNKGLRDENQDYIDGKFLDKEGTAIFVVADGIGGYAHGDIAARLVTSEVISYIEENFKRQQPHILLREAFANANESLFVKRISLNVAHMGCVAVAVLICNMTAYIAWIGDSRVYLFRKGKQVYRTTDHSVAEELSKIRTVHLADIEKYSSVVTKAIMGDDKYESPEMIKANIIGGDVLVLCTDGLFRQIAPSALAALDSNQMDAYLDKQRTVMEDNYSLIKIIV